MAGKTRPTNGTKIDGKYAAAILKTPFFFLFFYYTTPKKRELFSMHSVRQVSRKPNETFLLVLKFGFLNDLIFWARRESNPRLRASEARALIH